jgi:hypothetical protein
MVIRAEGEESKIVAEEDRRVVIAEELGEALKQRAFMRIFYMCFKG